MRCTPFTPVSNALPGKAGLTFKLFTLLHISWLFSNSKVPSSRTTFSKYIKTWLFHLKVQRPRAAFANPNCVFLLPVLEILPEGFWTPGTSPCCFSSVGIYSVRLWNSSRWRPARLSPREANCVTIWGRFVFPGGMCARSSGAPGWRHCARPAPQLPPLCGWTSAKAALRHPKTQGAGGRAGAWRAGNWYLPMRAWAWIFLCRFQKGVLETIRHFRRVGGDRAGRSVGTGSPTQARTRECVGPQPLRGVLRAARCVTEGTEKGCLPGFGGKWLWTPEDTIRRPRPPRCRQVQTSLWATWRVRASQSGRGGRAIDGTAPHTAAAEKTAKAGRWGPRPTERAARASERTSAPTYCFVTYGYQGEWIAVAPPLWRGPIASEGWCLFFRIKGGIKRESSVAAYAK